MKGFSTDTLKVETADGHNVVLLESFSYETKSGEVITVPMGTKSDGASTPKSIWNLIPPFGVYWKATFLHDYLYRNTERTRGECDSILLEAMEVLGTPLLERDTIYKAVAEFGNMAFQKDRVQEATENAAYPVIPAG
jgi:hypothetical protein